MARNGALKLGFFSYLEGDGPATGIYRNVTDLFVRAETLGLDTGWVAQHHFGHQCAAAFKYALGSIYSHAKSVYSPGGIP